MSFGIRHRHDSLSGRRIIINHIDFRIIRRFKHHFLRTVITPEDFRMHQHSPTGRSIEPSQIQNRLRLTGSEEIPMSIRPCFYPGMIIIRMRPTRRIHLTRRNTNRPESSYRKCRLFTTTPIRRLDGCQWRTGTRITRTIDYFLMTPVIHHNAHTPS